MTRLKAFTSSRFGAFEESRLKARNNTLVTQCGFSPAAFTHVMLVKTIGQVQFSWNPYWIDWGDGIGALMACCAYMCEEATGCDCCAAGIAVMADYASKIEGGTSHVAYCLPEGFGACSEDWSWCDYFTDTEDGSQVSSCSFTPSHPPPSSITINWHRGQGPPWAPGHPLLHKRVTGRIASYDGGLRARIDAAVRLWYYGQSFHDGEPVGYAADCAQVSTDANGVFFDQPDGEIWDAIELRSAIEGATFPGYVSLFGTHVCQDMCFDAYWWDATPAMDMRVQWV